MSKNYIILLTFVSIIYGQVPIGALGEIESLANDRLDDMREELMSTVSETKVMPDPTIEAMSIEIEKDREDLKAELEELSDYFGYSHFKRKINFYNNVPTPVDFRLGAGDEVILSLWGEVNLQEKFFINKDGSIFYDKIGFINLANKTISDAEDVLREKLSQTYSTIKDSQNSTNLMLELGRVRSVNVFFSGQITNPGIHIVHPFSDIFSAIIQADGIKTSGSLRRVELIRNQEVIQTIDFYDFFRNGMSNFSNIRILEGDIIHIPQIEHRSEILGAVNQPGYYELLPGELLSDMIGYAGGLTINAANSIMLHWIVPPEERTSMDDTMRDKSLALEEAASFILPRGSTVHVNNVYTNSYEVRVIGRVKNPGYYSATLTLREVLDLAGGFNDPQFEPSIRKDEIQVLRKDKNNFYSLEYQISYSNSETFDLLPDDKIFVYEDSKYRNNATVRIEGEVNKSGTFAFRQGMTVQDLLDLAEGFTPFANPNGVMLFDEWSPDLDIIELEEEGMDHSPTFQDQVSNITPDFIISKNAYIKVPPLKNHVMITGEVYRPGLVTFNGSKSVRYYLAQAGGITSVADFRDSYLMRANGEIVTLTRRSQRWIKVEPGDEIIIPQDLDPRDFDPTQFTSDIVSILTNLATIIFIVDSNSN